MSRKTIDRTEEENINNFGSKMIIINYRNSLDIDVYFPKYDWTAKNVRYNHFKEGTLKCPYEPRLYGHGYLGEGKYKVKENGKKTKCYNAWNNMLQRCYDAKYHKRYPTYKNCKVHNEWLNFQNFAKWYENNYYEIHSEKMHLDKDILVKDNKIYSAENCIFIPERINTLFTKCDKVRGEYPIGVSYSKRDKKFQAYCRIYDFKENKGKQIHLGYYETLEQAFKIYKQFKEQYIKQVAEYYKDKIPQKLYDAMYQYEVEITD